MCQSQPSLQLNVRKDIGLSEGYQHGLGAYIAQFAADLPDMTEAMIVVTHSRHIIRQLLPLNPTCIRVGGDLRSTAEWLEAGDIPKTIEEVLELKDTARNRYLALNRVLNERNKS